jgi:predicted GNAT family acetyltransferase
MAITDNCDASRYEMQVEGHLAIADYRLEGSKLYVTHVMVPPELRGGGVAAKLMAGVVADATQRGLEIVPICSYAASYLQRNPIG